jgi:hypothetical protein
MYKLDTPIDGEMKEVRFASMYLQEGENLSHFAETTEWILPLIK